MQTNQPLNQTLMELTLTIHTFNFAECNFIFPETTRIRSTQALNTLWGARNTYTILGETLKLSRIKTFIQGVTNQTIKAILEDYQDFIKLPCMLSETEQIFRLVYKLAEGDQSLRNYLVACASTINESLKSFNQLCLSEYEAYSLIIWEGAHSAYLTLDPDTPISLKMIRADIEHFSERVNELTIITL